MYTLIRHVGLRQALVREAPAATAALILAEVFYKFHSFTLECLAFGATWVALSALAHAVVPAPGRTQSA